MLITIKIVVATLGDLFRYRTALQAENLALRQQVAVLKRHRPRPRIRPADRLFWVILSRIWTD